MSEHKNTEKLKIIHDDEIDLIALTKTVWNARRKVIKITAIFMCIGLFIAIFSSKEYTATTVMIPQSNEGISLGGSLGGLAAMAGFDLGSAMGESSVPPTLYPQIVNSLHFRKEIVHTKLKFDGIPEKVSYYDYVTKYYKPGILYYIKRFTVGIPGLIVNILKEEPKEIISSVEKEELLKIGKKEYGIIKGLEKNLEIEINDRDGFIAIAGKMPEAMAAAQLTKSVQLLLQKHLQKIKSQKSQEQFDFIQERYFEKQEVFEKVQQKLARFRDQNKNMNSAISESRLEMLESEYDLAYGVYLELAKRLENQYIQLKEDATVFTVLQEVTVPVEKSKPNRLLIMISWTIVGAFLGLLLIIIPIFLKSITTRR